MTAKHPRTNASSTNELAQPSAAGSAWCQCEHSAHFPGTGAATPRGNREVHAYGAPCHLLVRVPTSRGEFIACSACAVDCFGYTANVQVPA